MFDEVEKMSKGLYKDMMTDFQKQQISIKMGQVNFQVEKHLDDGTVLRANSFNPILLVRAFKEFVKLHMEADKK